MADSAVPAAAHDHEHDSDPERLIISPVANDKHSSNGLHGLQPNEQLDTKQHDYRQQQMHENTYKNSGSVSATELQTQAISEEVHSGNQKDNFLSSNSNDDSQYLGGESFQYDHKDHLSAANLPGHVVNADEGRGLSHQDDEDEKVVSKPVEVSESGSSDDNDDDRPPSAHGDAYSAMMIANQFTTRTKEYREIRTATVMYSDPEMDCLRENDKVFLSELVLRDLLKKGGNGEVYRCNFKNYRGNKQLVCKIEHKILLCERKEFNQLCQLKDRLFIPILALREHRNYGYVGYLIMEYLPVGDIGGIPDYLKDRLAKAAENLRSIENKSMPHANRQEWEKCRRPWQDQTSLINKYQSALVRLINGATKTMKKFHNQGLLHLDIKEGNSLIRKLCNHKDKFDCGCDDIDFDVVYMDYDYVHEEGTKICDPIHTGTLHYRALPLQLADKYKITVKAEHQLDYYSLCVTIISIICGNEWCRKKLAEWERRIIFLAHLWKQGVDLRNIAEDLMKAATSSLIAEVRCVVNSIFGQKIEDIADEVNRIVDEVERKLQSCIEHFLAVQK